MGVLGTGACLPLPLDFPHPSPRCTSSVVRRETEVFSEELRACIEAYTLYAYETPYSG